MRRELLPMVRDALAGRYAIEREIARGGAAYVYAARDPEGRPVAVKILRPELAVTVTADRFLREVDFLRRLEHPSVAQVLDSGEAEFFLYYVMPMIDGPSLRQHLDRARRVSIDDTHRIGRDLLDALAYFHGRGIVHRDVKPDNIVLQPDGPVLVDFGIAKAIADAGTNRLTRSGFTVGTSHYMSPEQVLGAVDLDHRCDLYSLGCVLFECLAGRPPFWHHRDELVLHMQQVEPAPDVREFREDTPRGLAGVIARALEKERDRRWGTAGEMREALAVGG
jgi:eukaryotic-like serine/threonine-protein kinase